jgi:diguanylate cyclase (GGDEF)-like protein/PAS domain S-box-containing protein
MNPVLKHTHSADMAPAPAGRRRAVDRFAAAPKTRPGIAYAWGLLALLAGLALTLAMHQHQQRRQQVEQRALYTQLAKSGFLALEGQLQAAEWLLRSVQTLFLASDQVTEAEFAAFYENLHPREQFPSLLARAYAARETRADGEHYITRLVQPAVDNQMLRGLDLNTQPRNLANVLRSRDEDRATLSAPFPLVQRKGGSAPAMDGVTMRLPVFSAGPPPRNTAERRARAQGSIAVSYRVGELIGNALPAEVSSVLALRITDVTGGAALLLFASGPGETDAAVVPALERVLDFHGRLWKVRMWPVVTDMRTSTADEPVLPAGLLASVLLALLVFSVASTRQRALELGWRMSRRYRESEERFRALNELLPALVVLARLDGEDITYANQAARERFGEPVRHGRLADLFDEGHLPTHLRECDRHGGSRAETCLREGNGQHFWADVAMSKIMLDGESTLLMVATDISEQRALTQLLSHQASHDALTELYNRREFERRLRAALASAGPGKPLAAVLYLDLDQFKLINDTSGHLAGDRLLIQLATIMGKQLGSDDVLARLGGDEFGVLAFDLHDEQGAEAVAERMRRCIDGYVFIWEKNSYMISASIGVVLIGQSGFTMKDVLAQADTACYLAKEAGRNRVHFYRAQDDETAQRRSEMDWANRLRLAVSEQRLVLAYQEIRELPLAVHRAPRVELLLRFREDDGRLIAPGVFIPAAERYGLMPLIDRWVVETALANFNRMHPAGARLRMAAINLSGASVEDESLADLIITLLQRYRIAPGRVCFEITETVAVRNLSQVQRFMDRLRAVGCAISLDDFGAGMSSFTYLKNLPIDIIKIDGSFTRDMLTDPVSHAMVRAVADIGQRLGLAVVAEWAADAATVDALTALQVDFAQGFVLHEPELVPLHAGTSAATPGPV